ncbi:hypothetical protein GGI35DRAFT_490451 [Trichoderma velutinum]
MADPIDKTVSLAASLSVPFISIVESLECLEVDPRLGKDLNQSQVRLEALKLQLTRWGISNGILPDPQTGRQRVVNVDGHTAETAESLLIHILEVILELEKRSRTYSYPNQSGATNTTHSMRPDGLSESTQALKSKTSGIFAKRIQGVSLQKKTTWTLYEKENLDRLLENITENLNLLMMTCQHTEQQELCRMEVEEVQAGQRLDIMELLHDASKINEDRLLEDAIHRWNPRHSWERTEMNDNGNVLASIAPRRSLHHYRSESLSKKPILPRPSSSSNNVSQVVRRSIAMQSQPLFLPNRLRIGFNGKLTDMAKDWSQDEWAQHRRIVIFEKAQNGVDLNINFKSIPINKIPPNSICVSCIWWAEKSDYYITSIDIILLLEQLIVAPNRFTVEEKNRIRRNLEGFYPRNISRSKLDTEELFKIITAFPHPKPIKLEKDFKVFLWSVLEQALKKIISKFSSIPNSTIPTPSSFIVESSPLVPASISDGAQKDSGYGSSIQRDHDKLRSGSQETGTHHDIEPEFDDNKTVYSDLSSLSPDICEGYISGLTDLLANIVIGLDLDSNAQERILDILPDVLEGFALKIGHNAPNQMHRDVMVFVHKYRHDISTSFQERNAEPDNVLDRLASRVGNVSLNDNVKTWLESLHGEQMEVENFEGQMMEYNDYSDEIATDNENYSTSGGSESIKDNDSQTGQEIQETTKPWLNNYQDFIPKTEAYKWLVNRLQKEFRLAPAKPNIMDAVRLEISQSLQPVRRVSRKTSTKTYKVMFEVDWDITTFLEKQQYAIELAEAMERAITLTGSYQDAYISTCGQYLDLVWPLTGSLTLQLLKDAINGSLGSRHTCDLSDGTSLSARIEGAKVMIDVSGIIVSIVEVGEQLAWLGAALRMSSHDQEPLCCSPLINTIRNAPYGVQLQPPPDVIYKIGFTFETQQHSNSSNGRCWHNLFLNPTIVKGYPIPSRVEAGTGAEMSLNIMVSLARTKRVDYFKDMIFIKGFSTLLVPTKKSGNFIFWHLVYNKDGGRISYLEGTKTDVEHIKHLNLEQCRHILGWCSEADFYTGSRRANYAIANSILPKPHEGCGLANTWVSPGRCVIGGPAFSLGTKDMSFHASRGGYIPGLKWLSRRLVLLWDESEKRGWLVNGTSALLHIVRASLAHDSMDKFKSAFLFKESDLQDSATPFTADSAIDVLINPENLALKLYREKNGFLLLESRIEYFYNILEKLLDHQTDIAGAGGKNMINKPRRYLEGWNFNDLAMSRDPLYPRVATLEPHGKAWVDFIREIHAVTLFGCGFGELIKPSNAGMCEYWAEMPKQKYYIAACLSDMSQMINDNKHDEDEHVRVSEHVIWHTPTTLFGSCQCKGILRQDHSEPVQTLLPSVMSSSMLPRKFAIPPNTRSAILFGHHSAFPWIYGDRGDPKEGKFLPPEMSDVDYSKDSGIGLDMESPDPSINQLSPRRFIQYSSEDGPEPLLSNSASLMNDKSLSREDYTVGILCALSKELLAVRALFDERHEGHQNAPRDNNHYSLGRMGNHMVAALCLPSGEYGTTPAASSISNLTRSFPNVTFCLLVGIGGGAPSEENDIRLGDVVVSLPTGKYSGVIQYDRGKHKENDIFERTGTLHPPPWYLTTAISSLQSDPDLSSYPLQPYLDEIKRRLPEQGYQHLGQERDLLFQVACDRCQRKQECSNRNSHMKIRRQRSTDHPKIHYGLIASGNCVIKDSQIRDKWAQEYGVLCFEMEAAGVMNIFPCLVIRGISDYADSSKDKSWQNYAAATAAAYAKLLLSMVAVSDRSYRTSNLKRYSEAPEWESLKRQKHHENLN